MQITERTCLWFTAFIVLFSGNTGIEFCGNVEIIYCSVSHYHNMIIWGEIISMPWLWNIRNKNGILRESQKAPSCPSMYPIDISVLFWSPQVNEKHLQMCESVWNSCTPSYYVVKTHFAVNKFTENRINDNTEKL